MEETPAKQLAGATEVDGAPVSRTSALLFGLGSVAVAILLDQTIFPGHAKAVAFLCFMTAFSCKVVWPWARQRRVVALLIATLAANLLIAFVLPADGVYPGAALMPLAIVDFLAFYFVLRRLARPVS